MKRPYLTQHQRQLIVSGTLTGDLTMVAFRARQFEKAVIERFRLILNLMIESMKF